MNIRLARKSDSEQMNKIFDLYWHDDFRTNLRNKVNDYFEDKLLDQEFEFLVAEKDKELLGVIAYRNAPHHMIKFTHTQKPAELYVIAVKAKGCGIGTQLRQRLVEEALEKGYTELVFFSGESHKGSWDFHDNSNFKRIKKSESP